MGSDDPTQGTTFYIHKSAVDVFMILGFVGWRLHQVRAFCQSVFLKSFAFLATRLLCLFLSDCSFNVHLSPQIPYYLPSPPSQSRQYHSKCGRAR